MPPPPAGPAGATSWAGAGVAWHAATTTALLSDWSPSGTWGGVAWDAVNGRVLVSAGADGAVAVPATGGVAINVSAAAPFCTRTSAAFPEGDCYGLVVASVNAGGAGGGGAPAVNLVFALDGAPYSSATGAFGVGANVYALAGAGAPASPSSAGVANASARVYTGAAHALSGVYDPLSQTVLLALSNGTVLQLDAATAAFVSAYTPPAGSPLDVAGQKCGPAPAPCVPLAGPAVDGAGRAYFAAPAAGEVLVLLTNAGAGGGAGLASPLDSGGRPTPTAPAGCPTPAGVAVDPVAPHHLFVACADAVSPRLVVLESTGGGALVASLPAPPGVEAVLFDPSRGLIYAASGPAGQVAVARQRRWYAPPPPAGAQPAPPPPAGTFAAATAITYALAHVLRTAPGARALALDPASGAVFTAAPTGWHNVSAGLDASSWGVPLAPNSWLPNTLTLYAFVPPENA